MFTFGGEIEHVATVEQWERPGGVGDVQQRGTAFSLVFSPSRGRNATPGLNQKKTRYSNPKLLSVEGLLFYRQKTYH